MKMGRGKMSPANKCYAKVTIRKMPARGLFLAAWLIACRYAADHYGIPLIALGILTGLVVTLIARGMLADLARCNVAPPREV